MQVMQEGQTIKHEIFGLGIVTASDPERTAIDFDDHGPKLFVTSMFTAELIGEAPATPPKTKRRRKAAAAAKLKTAAAAAAKYATSKFLPEVTPQGARNGAGVCLEASAFVRAFLYNCAGKVSAVERLAAN